MCKKLIKIVYFSLLLSFSNLANSDDVVEVIHWWSSESETKAISYLAQEYKSRGGKWYGSAEKSFSLARERIIPRLAQGYYPTAMQWNAGQEIKKLYSFNFLRSLDELHDHHAWDNYYKPVLDVVQIQGKVLGVPVNIHGESWMWTNTKIFEALELKPPKTWDEVVEISPKLIEYGVTPVVVGDQAWQIRVLFNSILIGVAGKDIYQRLYRDLDITVLQETNLLEALSIFGQLRELSSKSKYGNKWNHQARSLAMGEAAILFMGDWVKPELMHLGKQLGVDFDCHLAPQSESSYLYLVDVFIFGRTQYEDEIQAQKKLLNLLIEDEVLYKFNQLKGSIPPIKDIDRSRLDHCGKTAARLMSKKEAPIEPYASIVRNAAFPVFDNLLAEIWTDKGLRIEDMVDMIKEVLTSLHEKDRLIN